jgi:phage gpG-like protein
VSPVVVATSDLPTQVFTIRGPSFGSSGLLIKVVGVDGTEYQVSSTTYVSQGVATFTLGTLSSTQLANQPFKIKIGSATSIDTISSFISLPTRSVNESLTYDLNNDLGIGSYTVSPTLPDGLSKSGGILSGTLTRAGTYDFTLTGTTPVPGGIWTEQAKINADNSLFASYNFFGHTVSISSDGNTAIVGAYGQESAYIFIRSNGNWTQQAKIEASDKASGDNFGLGVAISGDGNTVIVGAPREDPGDPAVTNAGSAYIFTHANGNWTQQAKINGSGNVYIGSFGARVAISGDGNTAIVGAPVKGSAYIFTRDSNGNWTQKEQFQESGVNFGDSVAISGDGNTAIDGAPREDVNGDVDAGSAYIFTHANGNWTEQATLNGSGSQYLGSFGSSVAISSDGNTAIVGAYKEWTDIANYGGSSYIFTRSNGNWTEQAKIYPSDQQHRDYYGRSVSISSDGNTAIAGSWAEDAGGTSNTGSAYIFTHANGNWTQQAKIVASDKEQDAQFGYSVAISGDGNTAIAGAWLDDLEGPNLNTGAAYIFALPLLSRDYRMVVTT